MGRRVEGCKDSNRVAQGFQDGLYVRVVGFMVCMV